MKNSSHRHDINRPRFRHGHKHTNKYLMMLIDIKHHLKLTSSKNQTTLRLS